MGLAASVLPKGTSRIEPAQRRILCAHISLFFVTLMTSMMIDPGSRA
jgi:hypothetical protein